MATATRPTTADPEAEPIDATTRLITPERVVFTYPLAGPARRALAYLIDAAVLGLIFAILVVVNLVLAATLGAFSQIGLTLAIVFVLVWGYGTVAEGAFNGRTVGKSLVGLRVLSTAGVPITGSQAAIRNLIGTVDGPLPFLFVPGLASMALTRRFQRLGDLAAGTMVVVEQVRHEAKLARVDDKAVADLLEYLPLRVAATPEQARAAADYVRSRGRFLPERREEIARHLADPLRERYALPGSSPGDAVLCAYYHRIFLGD